MSVEMQASKTDEDYAEGYMAGLDQITDRMEQLLHEMSEGSEEESRAYNDGMLDAILDAMEAIPGFMLSVREDKL